MASTNEAKYLGASITQTINPKHEIRKRISAAMAILKKLDIFWLKTQCSKKWKLLVYNAVITSKVLYGLETLEPTESASRLLNTFQLRGLRKIIRLHTTYIQRQNTNDYVYQRANEIVNGATDGPTRKIKPLTEILEERKLRLLGHVTKAVLRQLEYFSLRMLVVDDSLIYQELGPPPPLRGEIPRGCPGL